MRELQVHRSIRALRPVLQEFQDLFLQVGEAFPQDERFWYNERTLNGLLSTASWRCGLPSLIEAKTERRAGTKTKGTGHLDVLIVKGGIKLAVESKIDWLSEPDRMHNLIGKMQDATEEASGLPKEIGCRIALAFGILERGDIEPRQLLRGALKIARTAKLDILAWILDDAAVEKACYPGCIVVGSIVM